jgi:hypothetical protein
MLDNGIYPTPDELYLIFKNFDTTRSGRVNYTDFEKELLPRENKLLRKNVLGRPAYEVKKVLEPELELQLGRYFQCKIDGFMALAECRTRIKILSHDALREAFKCVDVRGTG